MCIRDSFQPVTVSEPNVEDTLKILQGIAHYYEQFHGVSIPQGVLRQAVLPVSYTPLGVHRAGRGHGYAGPGGTA